MNDHVPFVILLYVHPNNQPEPETAGFLQVTRAVLVGSRGLGGCSPKGKSAVLQHHILVMIVHGLQALLENLLEVLFEGDCLEVGVQVRGDEVTQVAGKLGRVLAENVARLVVGEVEVVQEHAGICLCLGNLGVNLVGGALRKETSDLDFIFRDDQVFL